MSKSWVRIFIGLSLCTALSVPNGVAAGEVTLKIENLRNTNGAVSLAIYDRKANFLKPDLATKAIRIVATKAGVIALGELRPGSYAVTIYHDENNNKKLDKNFLGVPSEGYGFSNNARGSFGPPDFDAAKFQVSKNPHTLAIRLAY